MGAIHTGLLLKPTNASLRYAHNRSFTNQHVVDADSFDSWGARMARGASTGTVSPMKLNEPHHTRLSMSLQTQSNSNFRPHQRVQTLRRFKTAICLIATRGAAAKEVEGRLRLVFDETDVATGWILQGVC